jgi:hypothetical protein
MSDVIDPALKYGGNDKYQPFTESLRADCQHRRARNSFCSTTGIGTQGEGQSQIENDQGLLDAASLDALKRTHKRYFEDLHALLAAQTSSEDSWPER